MSAVVSALHGSENRARQKLEKLEVELRSKGEKAKGLKERVDFVNQSENKRSITNQNTLSKLMEELTKETIKPIGQPEGPVSGKTDKHIEIAW